MSKDTRQKLYCKSVFHRVIQRQVINCSPSSWCFIGFCVNPGVSHLTPLWGQCTVPNTTTRLLDISNKVSHLALECLYLDNTPIFHNYTPLQRSWKGDILVSRHPSLRPTVRLWTKSCPLCIFHNTSRINFIFAYLIKQLPTACRV